MPRLESVAKKQDYHMLELHRRADKLVLSSKWWNCPGIDSDFRVYAVEYLPATYEGVVAANRNDWLHMLLDCVQ